MAEDTNRDSCELCGRAGVVLTRHHLIPRRTHRLKRIRKSFDRARRQGDILRVCRPCHKQIHVLFDEKTLAARYNTRAALLADPEMAKFVAWLADKPPGFVPRARRPRR